MTDKPTVETRGYFARFRRLPAWKQAGLGVAAFVALVFVIAAVAPTFNPARRAAGLSAGTVMFGGSASPERMSLVAEKAKGLAGPADAFSTTETSAAAPLPALETWDRQLILNASLALEMRDVRAAYDRVQMVAAAEGALITAASLQAGSGGPREVASTGAYGHASLVLRMPQSRFYAVRQRLASLAPELGGKLLRDEVSSQDVTEEYVDLKARLRNWKSQEAQLLTIMSQARRIPDILAVRNQLSEVQQEIERVTGRLRFLENRVDLSTISVEIYQKGKGPLPPTIASTWRNAGKGVAAATMRSLRDTVGLLGAIAAALIYILPFALILAALWAIIRAARRKTQAARG